MRSITVTILALVCATGAAGQTGDEFKAAAEKWLAQNVLKMDYKSAGGWSSVLEVNLKSNTTNFVGSNDRFCYGSTVPTKVSLIETQLVVAFEPARGCTLPQYRFNPVSGVGKILLTVDGGASWTENSKGAIALIK